MNRPNGEGKKSGIYSLIRGILYKRIYEGFLKALQGLAPTLSILVYIIELGLSLFCLFVGRWWLGGWVVGWLVMFLMVAWRISVMDNCPRVLRYFTNRRTRA